VHLCALSGKPPAILPDPAGQGVFVNPEYRMNAPGENSFWRVIICRGGCRDLFLCCHGIGSSKAMLNLYGNITQSFGKACAKIVQDAGAGY